MASKSATNLFLVGFVSFLCSCTGFLNKSPNSGCNKPQKITGITADDVYDLSGYMANGGSSPFRLFDENDNFDPKNGVTGTPTTSPQPTKQADIFFPLGKGNRIVVDLRVAYKLSEVYVYDQSRASDSVWIYTGTMKNWKLQSAFLTSADPTTWGWKRYPVQDSAQFLMIRFESPQADLKEMILYGCPTATVPPRNSETHTGERLPKKTI